jgi:predicted NBD/HSP70 family sugar kinase
LKKLQKATGLKLTFREFCSMSEDSGVDKILIDMIDQLSHALVDQVNMLNPQMIFIGHEGSYLPNKYIERLRNEVNLKKFSQNYLQVGVEKSLFGFLAP